MEQRGKGSKPIRVTDIEQKSTHSFDAETEHNDLHQKPAKLE